MELDENNHSVFSLWHYLVLVVKYRRKAINQVRSYTSAIMWYLPGWGRFFQRGSKGVPKGQEYEYIVVADPPDGTDFALKVRGDSMEPMYSDE